MRCPLFTPEAPATSMEWQAHASAAVSAVESALMLGEGKRIRLPSPPVSEEPIERESSTV